MQKGMSLSKSERNFRWSRPMRDVRPHAVSDGKDASSVSSSTRQSAIVSYKKRTDNERAEDQVLL